MKENDNTLVRLKDYRPPDFLFPKVDLDFRLGPRDTIVTASHQVQRNRQGNADAALELDGEDLELLSIAVDGVALAATDYRITKRGLVVTRALPDRFRLDICNRLDPDANTRLSGLYRSRGTYCTQCEAEGFRRIAFFPDRPDVLSVYTTRVEADKADAPVLLSNGNPVAGGDIAGSDRHFAVWHDPFPKPCYLFALVGGDLALVRDRHTTGSGREVELRLYVEPGNERRCGYALDALKRAMVWDEEVFGREYDLDTFMIVAVADFNMGAMENKGLNIFNDKYILADPESATDTDYAHIEAIVAHEYFHNWTGNRITCRDWFQLCLKEGLTVYRDQEFTADMRSRPVKRIADVRLLTSHQFPEDAGPLAHPVQPQSYREINNFYTATVYEKGAELVRMLATFLGAERFRAGMDAYFLENDGRAATVDDFLAAFEGFADIDLGQFRKWYEQAGTPELTVHCSHDPAAATLTLIIEQATPPTPGQGDKHPVPIPLRLGLISASGEDLPLLPDNGARLGGDVLHITERKHVVRFANIPEKPVVSLLRGFSAPVRLSFEREAGESIFLMRHDSDPFNRWRAAQDHANRILKRATAAWRAGERAGFDDEFLGALAEIAEDEELDHAFRAQMLTLPSEADIAREIGHDIDTDAIAAARRALLERAAGLIGGQLVALHERLATGEGYRPDAEQAGRRALRNAALDLAASNGDAAVLDLVVEKYLGADNMTDRLAALQTISTHDPERRLQMLDDFFHRYRNNPLVIDKWLTLHAIAPFPDTLDRVIELTRHEAFSFANPNRVRALIGAFATGNQAQFNRRDGAGFDFVAENVLRIDKTNPQLAARLLSCFRSWRALEERRRQKARAALQRVVEAEGISRDVADIARRCTQ